MFKTPSNKDEYLNGIISYLKHKGKNITITCSSVYKGFDCLSCIEYNNKSSFWHSQGNAQLGEWIQIEFNSLWVTPHTITYQETPNGYHNRNWEIRTSFDGTHWSTIDSHVNDESINAAYQKEAFHVDPIPMRFLKFVQTGYSEAFDKSGKDYHFRVGKLELFGAVSYKFYSFCQRRNSFTSFSMFSVILMIYIQ